MLIHLAGAFVISLVLTKPPVSATMPTPGTASAILSRTPLTGNPLSSQTSFLVSSARRFNNASVSFWGSNGASKPARDISRIQSAPSKSNRRSRFDECLYRGSTRAMSTTGTMEGSVCAVCSVLARRQRVRNEVTKVCAVWVTTWLCRSSQRDRASSSPMVNAYTYAEYVYLPPKDERSYLIDSVGSSTGVIRVDGDAGAETRVAVRASELAHPINTRTGPSVCSQPTSLRMRGRCLSSWHSTNSCVRRAMPSRKLVTKNASATVNSARYWLKVTSCVCKKTTGW
jgi:hypothetical protein